MIEFEWWKELGQLATWENIILYSFAPLALATVWRLQFSGLCMRGR